MQRTRVWRWLLAIVVAVSAFGALSIGPAHADTIQCPAVGTPIVDGYPLPPGTGEVSGLVASTRYPGWGWMIRDSGSPADLYAVRFPGGSGPHEVRPVRVLGAANIDWEDIAYQDGTLYVIESDQSRRARVIYEIPEPDPLGPGQVRATARYGYAYPGGRRYNTETAFFFAGHLVLVPKTTPARLYRFDQPLSVDRVNQRRLVGALPGSNTVSVAQVAPDGKTLVAANHQELFSYQTPLPATYLREFTARPVYRQRIATGTNVESGAFFLLGGCKLVLFAENRTVYRIFATDSSQAPPRASRPRTESTSARSTAGSDHFGSQRPGRSPRRAL